MAGKTDRTAININSIARQAHVSTTTVSNLINSTEVFPISPETRERILRVMRELNYRPHIGGSLMRRNVPRRPKLGFVFGEECMNPILHTAGNPLVQRFLRELESAIEQELDWELAILRVNDENSRSEWNERLIDVEAVVNFGQLNCLMCDTMVRRNLPLINVYPHTEVRRHGSFAGIPDEFDFVFWRNERQMENIFQHFYARGARRFLFLATSKRTVRRGSASTRKPRFQVSSGRWRRTRRQPAGCCVPESRGSTRWPANTTWPGR